jgi:hypothetical protein
MVIGWCIYDWCAFKHYIYKLYIVDVLGLMVLFVVYTGSLSVARTLEVKQPGRETDHSLLTSAMSRKCGSIRLLPNTSSWRSV